MRTEDVRARRLTNQRITGERCTTPGEVVRWMGALQAQDYGQALWGIGLRMQSATVAEIERAIAERAIILTWPLRGTLHAVPAEDAAWMLTLSAPRTLAADRRRLAQLELDETVLERCKALFHYALSGGKRLTRAAMMALLEGAGIHPGGQRGYHILWHIAQSGLICLGPLQDKQQTFVLLDEWIAAPRRLSREEGMAELAVRYFTSHGPATTHDFARWVGLTIAEARMGIEGAAARLTSEKRGGKDYWTKDDAAVPMAGDAAGVFLLPGFDEYVIGYQDRDDVLAPEHAAMVVPGKNGIFLPTIVVAGQVVGTWKRTRTKRAISITLHPFAELDAPEEGIAAVAARYGAFVGAPVAYTEIKGP